MRQTQSFRFHTGSIKRKNDLPIRSRKMKSFDSILVRLKEHQYQTKSSDIVSFRFHTGSIKRKVSLISFPKLFWFRFHTGSIKRNKFRSLWVQALCSFDSILVRLKVFCLKTPPGECLSFDSILVRLKVRISCRFVGYRVQFRFHTGSIKIRGSAIARRGSLIRVSIPYWFD